SLFSATYFPQSEISPLIITTFAPNALHSITLAVGVSAGMAITAGIPAAAAYAASAPPALPALGAASAFAPRNFAMVTAAVIPRALNDPVGFSPSSFTYNFGIPIDAPSRGVARVGVIPSPNVTFSPPGNTSSYLQRVLGRFWRASRDRVLAARWR